MANDIGAALNTLPSLPQIVSHYGPSFLNGFIVLSTIGGQSIINKLAFICPCSYPLNEYHSIGFLFGPCIALFLLAVLINQKTWRLAHGCCYRTRSTQHPVSTSLLYWLEIISQALVAPIAWLFVSLLDGSYYKCLFAAHYCENVPNCSTPLKSAICEACICNIDKIVSDKLISESQFLAWLLLVGTGIAASIVMCCVRIFSRFTYSQSNYVELYRTVEEKVFDELAKENATFAAKEHSSRFFNSKRIYKIDWDAISALPEVENPVLHQIGLSRTGPETTQAWQYTTLQKWNNEKPADTDDNKFIEQSL